MRALATVALVLLMVLAGCGAGFQGGPATDTPADTPVPDEPPTATPTATPNDGPGTETETPTPEPEAETGFDFADPTSDRLGWEAGYWYNESLPVTPEDGLNDSELDAVVARSMARVEHVRELEFEETVPVTVINRSVYRSQYAGATDYTEAFTTFDNTKFESLLLVGEDRDALDVQNANRGSNVLGFYSPANDTIVIVAESDSPTLDDEFTLAHELVHAVQDQRYNLSSYVRPTREVYNAYNGIIEGDANLVQQRYQRACEADWECLSVPSEGGGGGGDLHFGVYFLNFFPYSDGPGFVAYHERRGGWAAVNDIYANPPGSSEQVIYPERYGEDAPTDVNLTDSNTGEWERVVPEPQRPGQVRPPYASFGQAGIVSMFAYTIYDEYNRSRVIDPRTFLNLDADGDVNSSDPLNYAIDYAGGWDGDRLHVYDRADDNETAYVWRIVWDSPEEAAEFATGYRALLAHWGGERVADSQDHWVIDEGPFADAFYVEVEGDTVTIVNGPTQEALGGVYGSYEPPA